MQSQGVIYCIPVGYKILLRKHGGKTKKELEATEPVAEPPTAKAPDISIHDAALVGNIEAVKQHIAASTDVNAKNYFGGTPLHGAGTKEVTKLLIAAGADVNAKSMFDETPLDLSKGETADLLRKHGGKTGEELKAEGK